jgi:hypothetical protein
LQKKKGGQDAEKIISTFNHHFKLGGGRARFFRSGRYLIACLQEIQLTS